MDNCKPAFAPLCISDKLKELYCSLLLLSSIFVRFIYVDRYIVLFHSLYMTIPQFTDFSVEGQIRGFNFLFYITRNATVNK